MTATTVTPLTMLANLANLPNPHLGTTPAATPTTSAPLVPVLTGQQTPTVAPP